MSTRSDIIVHQKDGKWKRIYCHFDGYLDHNGRILNDHYNSQKLAEKLVGPGHISFLRPKCDKPSGHSFDHPVNGYTVYYGRDRGEPDSDGTIADSLAGCWPLNDTWTEFTYVWDNGKWYVANPNEGSQTLVKLADALKSKKTLGNH